jgi:2-polyprenyl-6-methoxyphenol hydroxylase-like FAD-dependent oxidoreductase
MEAQLRLGHSIYNVDFNDSNGVKTRLINGLSRITPEGRGKYYFHIIQYDDAAVQDGKVWAWSATKEELQRRAVEITSVLPSKFKALVEKAKAEDMKCPPLRLYTLVMSPLPVGRVVLLGDAAHAMTPCE